MSLKQNFRESLAYTTICAMPMETKTMYHFPYTCAMISCVQILVYITISPTEPWHKAGIAHTGSPHLVTVGTAYLVAR